MFALTSSATNLVAGDTNGQPDVFIARLGSGPNWLVTGTNGTLRGYDVLGQLAQLDRQAFEEAFQGGVRIALADVTGNGAPNVIVAPGPGRPPLIRVFSDSTAQTLLTEFLAYDPAFTGGVYVAACDVDGSGRDAIVTGAGPGGSPHVRILKLTGDPGQPVTEVTGFLAYEPEFAGGVRVGCRALVAGATRLVTGPGPGSEPLVKVFNVAGGAVTPTGGYFPFEPTWAGGVSVAVGIVKEQDLETLAPPSRPIITSPPAGSRFPLAAPTPVTVAWTPAAGAASYFLEHSGPGLQFANPNGTTNDSVNGLGGAGGGFSVPGVSHTFELPPSVPPGRYQVRVIGLAADGTVVGTASDAVTVVLGGIPPPPVPLRPQLLAPAPGSRFPLTAPTTVSFAWTPVPGAVQYLLEYTGPNLEFGNPNDTIPDPANGFGGAGGALVLPDTRVAPELAPTFPPGIYQVRVLGLDASGDPVGTFSDAVPVVVRASPIVVNATIVAGRGPGGAPEVHLQSESIRNGQLTGQVSTRSFLAFPPEYTGGVNVGTGDATGAGGQQVVVAPGSSTSSEQPVTVVAPQPEEVQVVVELPTGVEGPSGGAESGGGGGGTDAGGF